MSSSRSPYASSSDPVATPPSGLDLAPRGRRWDHILTALAGVALCPAALALIGMSATAAAEGHPLRAALLLLGLVALCLPACLLFAARSSVGLLAAGLSALAVQVAILLAPGHAATLPAAWARTLVSCGAALLAGGLWLGAAWGMRLARRGGHLQGRSAFRLTRADKEIGTTPAPPPSRRPDHLLSLPWVLAALGAAFPLLYRSYAEVSSPGVPTGLGAYASVLTAFVLLIIAAASTGRSSLGARAGGVAIIVLVLPALADPTLAWYRPLVRLVPHGPGPAVIIAVGLMLLTSGWGAHMARRQGRSHELADLRSGPTRLSERAGSHYGEHTQGGTREH
ncbi:hypothetical protein NSA19_00495 [Actinomyces bowdenii]|uniref:hypothetical protein n=1 Tax=Actinomyces bowdenii TaxID=131109 RepID=UPI00214C5B84|nr:hypothetical protein [Actinomyces bowdenii]